MIQKWIGKGTVEGRDFQQSSVSYLLLQGPLNFMSRKACPYKLTPALSSPLTTLIMHNQ